MYSNIALKHASFKNRSSLFPKHFLESEIENICALSIIKNGIQKYLLRELVSEYLDDSITNSPKRPLQTPQREWLGNELSDYVESKIEDLKDSDFSSWFDINEMSIEWQKYKDGDNDSSFHIWQWISLSNLIKN